MNLNIPIKTSNTVTEFIKHWSKFYQYKYEDLYKNNIGKTVLTNRERLALFTWKNGGPLSAKKVISVCTNYPLDLRGYAHELLSASHSGGPIWNIYYMHLCNQSWPIFDQHTYRAMEYIMLGEHVELPQNKATVYEIYKTKYIPFFDKMSSKTLKYDRNLDKALFIFGKFLKSARQFA